MTHLKVLGIFVFQNIQAPMSRWGRDTFSGMAEEILNQVEEILSISPDQSEERFQDTGLPCPELAQAGSRDAPALKDGDRKVDFLRTAPQWAVLYLADKDKSHRFSLEGLKQCGQVQIFSRLLSWRVCLMRGGLKYSFQSARF